MHTRWIGIVALGLLAVPGLSPSTSGALAEELSEPEHVVVQYDTGIPARALTTGEAAPSLEAQGFRRVEVPPGVTREKFLEELRRQPGVLSAEADVKVYADALPNDPFYAANQAAYLNHLNAPAAWDLETGTGAIVVAVVDTGLDLGHEDFGGRLWENTADAFSDGFDHDGNGCINDRYGCRFVNVTPTNAALCGYTSSTANGNVLDDHGKPGSLEHSHGTLVSGIIGAAGDNGVGVAGIAWNVRFMTIKVLDCGAGPRGPEGDMFNVAQGIDYARRMGANVINISLASKAGDQQSDLAVVRAAIQAAQDQGIIVVAAAGNHSGGDSVGVGYPGAYTQFTNLITVGAADSTAGYTWATYSNYGPAVDFAAPGNDIASTVRSDLGLGSPYRRASPGTSFATPLVSGLFALMMSRNSLAAASDLIQVARDTAAAAPPAPHGQNWAGAGIINIGAAVQRVPMVITGSPLHDWKDVAAGTDIRATIDGIECGSTTASVFAVVARYAIRVKPAAEQAGCGAPGKVVQLSIAGRAAVPTFTWGARNEGLGLANRDVSSVSAPPGPIVVQALTGGWSNIAHLEASGAPTAALSYLPAGWTSALRWDAAATNLLQGTGSYLRFSKGAPAYANQLTSVQTYDAYWVDAPTASAASLNPNPPPGRVVQLAPGWNNFVYTGSNRSVEDALAQVAGKYTQVLQYDNASRTWLSHLAGQRRFFNDFGGLFKLKVYWIFMTQPGSITMN